MIYNTDWLNNDIPDKSIHLIIADPPYFEVKGEFDFIWKSFADYLQDVESWAIECKRVLADNGCLFWWGHAKKIAYSQIIFDKYFKLINNVIWKNTNPNKLNHVFDSGFRSFPPVTEHLLYYSNEWDISSGNLIVDKATLKNRDYLRSEIMRAKGEINFKEINILLGTASNGGGVASSVLSDKKAENTFITKDHYLILRDWLNDKNNNIYLKKEYNYLRQEYEDLRQEYEELRRPFNNQYNFSDVIEFPNFDNNILDHDTIKPLTLTKKLIQTTTREGDTVLIPFGGSGTEVEACIDTGRKYICYEISGKHYDTIKEREKQILLQPALI